MAKECLEHYCPFVREVDLPVIWKESMRMQRYCNDMYVSLFKCLLYTCISKFREIESEQ